MNLTKEEQERIELKVLKYCCDNGFKIEKYSQYNNPEYKYYLTDYDYFIMNKEIDNFQDFCKKFGLEKIVENILDSRYILLNLNNNFLKNILDFLHYIDSNANTLFGLILIDNRIDWNCIFKSYLLKTVNEYYLKYINVKISFKIKGNKNNAVTIKVDIKMDKKIKDEITKSQDIDLPDFIKLYNLKDSIKIDKYLRINIKVK